jgi:hypothetical protein
VVTPWGGFLGPGFNNVFRRVELLGRGSNSGGVFYLDKGAKETINRTHNFSFYSADQFESNIFEWKLFREMRV